MLDDSGSLGGTVAALTGCRARPDLISLLVYGLYWGVILVGLRRHSTKLATTPG